MSQKIKKENNSHDQSLKNSIVNKSDDVPFDILFDILMRLPVKSITRFLLVSKFWSETIRSRHFITSYQVRSALQQPRLLVVFTDFGGQDSYFFSVGSSSTTTYLSRITSVSSSTTTYLSRVTCPFYNPIHNSHYVNGLISLGSGLDKCIANPSTGSYTVFRGEKSYSELERSFIGYDPVNDEYKILVYRSSYSHYQAVTLGAKNEKWRRIDHETRYHCPAFNSVCIDGVLYFVAYTGSQLSQLSLMRFNLESEKLDLFTSLLYYVRAESLKGSMLISYKKKVAFATKISIYDHEVWVLDQHGWVKKSFRTKIICSKANTNRKVFLDLYVRGSTLTGEFILAPKVYSDIFCVIHYNPDTKCYQETDVEVQEDFGFKHRGPKKTEAMVFSEYTDCVRLL